LDSRLTTLLCKKKYSWEYKEVKTGCAKEDYGSKRAVLHLMMMMISCYLVYVFTSSVAL
jgi:hypothetical protein